MTNKQNASCITDPVNKLAYSCSIFSKITDTCVNKQDIAYKGTMINQIIMIDAKAGYNFVNYKNF